MNYQYFFPFGGKPLGLEKQSALGFQYPEHLKTGASRRMKRGRGTGSIELPVSFYGSGRFRAPEERSLSVMMLCVCARVCVRTCVHTQWGGRREMS